MTLPLCLLVFITSIILSLSGTVSRGDLLLTVGTIGAALSGVNIGLAMALGRFVYTSCFFLFHLVMSILTVYIYLNRQSVAQTPEFVFSTFTDENLRTAIVLLSITLLTSLMPWWLTLRRSDNLLRISPQEALVKLAGRLDLVKSAWIEALILCSFAMAVALFLTNTSVVQVPYPDQTLTQWIPSELLKVPTILAVIALIVCYSKYLSRGPSYFLTLNIARLNFIVTLILMLVLTGSRAFFTFLWLFVGIFEMYLFLKRIKTALPWAGLFLALAWFSYYSWPFLRTQLSVLPLGSALSQAMDIGLLRRTDPSAALTTDTAIHIESFAMIGASLFHLLYVIQLISDGISLAGSTFTNLPAQALPDFLDGILWTRPLNDNWRLAEQYHHGGGFLVIANAYWNGGALVMVGFVAAVSTLFLVFDRHLLKSGTGILYKAVYWLWIPVMVSQLGYGIQGLMRVIELLGATILVDQIRWSKSAHPKRKTPPKEIPLGRV